MKLIPIVAVKAQNHPIKSVTIFKSSKAEIVREFSLTLKSGQNKVEIDGLPSTIDAHSVRVSGLGDARLSDVVCTIGTPKDATHAPDSSEEITRLLEVQREALESEKRIREEESQILSSYAKTLSGEHVSPHDMANFLASFVEQGRVNLKALNELDEQILAIDRKIEEQQEKAASKTGITNGKVTVVLGTDETTQVDLKLTYIVSDVHWTPTYELHASTENGKPLPQVSLHYQAHVRQSTGEDWTNTSLTLSTVAFDHLAKKIPELRPVKLQASASIFQANNDPAGAGFVRRNAGFAQQPQKELPKPKPVPVQSAYGQPTAQQHTFGQQALPPPPPMIEPGVPTLPGGGGFQALSGFFGSSTPAVFGSASVAVDEMYQEIVPATITTPAAFVAETPIAISYSIKGDSTIPSDGVEHQVSVAVLPFEAEVSYVAIPRIDPRVYLQCQVKNTSEYRLLAGPVSVILDDSYVSKAAIADVNMGDNFECTLGDDPATKVTYSRTSRVNKIEGGAFAEVTHTTAYNTKITIYNKHAFVLPDLVVRDVIPTCDDKRAKVVLRKPEGLANAKEGQEIQVGDKEGGLTVAWAKVVDGKGGEKEGRFEWKGSVKAKDKVVLEAQWEIRGPTDVSWVETTAGLFEQLL